MRGSTHPRVSFCQSLSALASFLLSFPVLGSPSLRPREICFGLWEVRPRLRISFVEVNVFNFATEKERRATRREGDGERKRWKGKRRQRDEMRTTTTSTTTTTTTTTTTRPRLDRASLPRRLAFYRRETRRLLRHGSMTLRGGWKGGRKMQRGFGRAWRIALSRHQCTEKNRLIVSNRRHFG